ncbi:hypothetical protein MVEN_02027600 [Mycena venus]|uniref:Transmembrane protein n=1 Tax=Mycena venus TaxID=2733690 RepID=A0A8H7CJ05_9AGAR|nr:hypothetical protein MVEN_02027600 [Mycena venus]
MQLPRSLIFLLFAVLTSGGLTNTTIDDSSSSFTFSDGWTAITPSSPCHGCASKPDPTLTYGGTWHNGNYRDGASTPTTGSFTFTGSAVYIFGIDQDKTQPNIVFRLDSIQQVHHYTGTERFVYNALFFFAEDLAPAQTHTVNWVFELADTGVGVQAALFDYAIVTTGQEDVEAPPPPSSTFVFIKVAGFLKLSPVQTQSDTGLAESDLESAIGVKFRFFWRNPLPLHHLLDLERASLRVGQVSLRVGKAKANLILRAGSLNCNLTAGLILTFSASPSGQSTVTVSGASGLTTVTAPAGASSKSNSSNLGAIIVGVVGGLSVIALAMLFAWCRLQRRRRIKSQAARTQFLRIEDSPLHTRQLGNSGPISLSTSGSQCSRSSFHYVSAHAERWPRNGLELKLTHFTLKRWIVGY